MIDLKAYDNRLFRDNIGASGVKRFAWYFFNIVLFKSALFPFYGIKVMVLRWFGAAVGSGVVIKPGVSIKFPWKLKIGDNCWLGENVWIDNLDEVEIGNQVVISQGAMLLCGNHNYNSKSFDLIIRPIQLKDGVWIGARATVCPGVVCHQLAVLTVNSVATGDLEAVKIYQGNPAVYVRDRKVEGGG